MNLINKSIKFLLLIAAIFVLQSVSNKGFAQTTNHKAYSLFLYNFTKYTHWSEDASQGDVVITVLGNSGITEFLEKVTATKKLNARSYRIVQASSLEEIPEQTHLVYIPALKSGALKSVVEKFSGNQTLIVTEREGLINKGAHISFVVLENGSLRFQLNREALMANKLQLASALVAMAY